MPISSSTIVGSLDARSLIWETSGKRPLPIFWRLRRIVSGAPAQPAVAMNETSAIFLRLTPKNPLL